MDALTFATPILVRKMTFANQSKSMVQTINYKKAMEGLGLSHDEFVDLCILLGCDYTDTIKGVGPKTALKLIREHKNIEQILKHIDRNKHVVPKDWIPEGDDGKGNDSEEHGSDNEHSDENDENSESKSSTTFIPAYVQARKLFKDHDVKKGLEVELKWKEPQAEALIKFLVDENGFNPERVKANVEKLQKAYKANQKPQSRMDSFFQVKQNPISSAKRAKKLEDDKVAKKKAKTAGGRKRR